MVVVLGDEPLIFVLGVSVGGFHGLLSLPFLCSRGIQDLFSGQFIGVAAPFCLHFLWMAAVLDDAVYNPYLEGIIVTVLHAPVFDLVFTESGHDAFPQHSLYPHSPQRKHPCCVIREACRQFGQKSSAATGAGRLSWVSPLALVDISIMGCSLPPFCVASR